MPTVRGFGGVVIKLNIMIDEKRKIAAESRRRWSEVDEMQKRLRNDSKSRISLSDAMNAFDMSFRSAIFRLEKRKTSGMVDFYKRMGLVT